MGLNLPATSLDQPVHNITSYSQLGQNAYFPPNQLLIPLLALLAPSVTFLSNLSTAPWSWVPVSLLAAWSLFWASVAYSLSLASAFWVSA